jgi:hypothetical protein
MPSPGIRIGSGTAPTLSGWEQVAFGALNFVTQAKDRADQLRPVGMALGERLEFADEILEDARRGPCFKKRHRVAPDCEGDPFG